MDHSGHESHSGHNMHGDHGSLQDVLGAVTEAAANLVSSTGHAHAHVHAHGDAEGHARGAEGAEGGAMDHSGHTVAGHAMSMTFHGGYSETVLFEWWNFNSAGGLFGSIVAIFVLAVLYEGLKYYREHLFWRTYNNLQYRSVQPPEEKATPADQARVVHMVGEVFRKQPPSMCSRTHAWQTCLHAVQVSVSYLLMLVFMTYNTWLCLAVVAGAACGNFLFGWKKSVIVDVTEHCH